MQFVMSKEHWETFIASCGEELGAWTRMDAERLRVFLEEPAGTGRRLMRKLLVFQGSAEALLLNAPMDTEPQIRQMQLLRGKRQGVMLAIEEIATAVMFDFSEEPTPIPQETSEREEI